MPHIVAELHTVVDRVNAVGDAHHHAGTGRNLPW